MNRIYMASLKNNNSFISTLDSFVKLLCFFILIVMVVISKKIIDYGIIIFNIFLVIKLSNYKIKYFLKDVYRIRKFLFFIFFLNFLFFENKNPIIEFYIFTPTVAGCLQGIKICFNVIIIIFFGKILTSTTTPLEIVDAIKTLIYPLSFIKIPVQDIAMVLGISLQFIPIIEEETNIIKKAQIIRGNNFSTKKIKDKIITASSLVVPIFVATFRRADELSLAMEARGFRKQKGKLKIKKPEMTFNNIICLIFVAIESILVIML